MTPIATNGSHSSQMNLTPIYDNTDIVLRRTTKGILLYENCELITLLTFSLMSIVRGIKELYPNAKLRLI